MGVILPIGFDRSRGNGLKKELRENRERIEVDDCLSVWLIEVEMNRGLQRLRLRLGELKVENVFVLDWKVECLVVEVEVEVVEGIERVEGVAMIDDSEDRLEGRSNQFSLVFKQFEVEIRLFWFKMNSNPTLQFIFIDWKEWLVDG